MKSFNGKTLEVGDLVAFAEGSPQIFKKGYITKIGEKKIKIAHSHEVGKYLTEHLRYPEQVVFIGEKVDTK